MADSSATTSEEDLADMPRLVNESDLDDDSDSGYELPPSRPRKQKKKRRVKSGKRKYRKNRKRSQKTKKRKVVGRNTTYASKRSCLDPDAITAFLGKGDCGCENKCIDILKSLSDDAGHDVVLQLRKERFSCKFMPRCKPKFHASFFR